MKFQWSKMYYLKNQRSRAVSDQFRSPQNPSFWCINVQEKCLGVSQNVRVDYALQRHHSWNQTQRNTLWMPRGKKAKSHKNAQIAIQQKGYHEGGVVLVLTPETQGLQRCPTRHLNPRARDSQSNSNKTRAPPTSNFLWSQVEIHRVAGAWR